MDFRKLREDVVVTLNAIGISLADIHLDKDANPRNFPCAIVSLANSKGDLMTSFRYVKHKAVVRVFLVIDAKSEDPDADIYKLSMLFREAYLSKFRRDVDEFEYYPSRADASRKVMIAKFDVKSI